MLLVFLSYDQKSGEHIPITHTRLERSAVLLEMRVFLIVFAIFQDLNKVDGMRLEGDGHPCLPNT